MKYRMFCKVRKLQPPIWRFIGSFGNSSNNLYSTLWTNSLHLFLQLHTTDTIKLYIEHLKCLNTFSWTLELKKNIVLSTLLPRYLKTGLGLVMPSQTKIGYIFVFIWFGNKLLLLLWTRFGNLGSGAPVPIYRCL